MSLRPRRPSPSWWGQRTLRLTAEGEGPRARRPAPRPYRLGEVDPLGAAARAAVVVLLPLGWRLLTTGREHLPATGPAVIAANHRGLLDGPLLWAHVWLARGRPVAFLVKADMFTGLLGVLLRATGQIPVESGSGARALVAAAGVLARGGVVGVFPEGTRGDGSVEAVREGAAWLALRSGAPVVPVAMTGTAPGDAGRGLSLAPLPALRSRLAVHVAPPVTLGGPPTPTPSPPSRTATSTAPSTAAPTAARGTTTRRADLARATETVRVAMASHVRDATTTPPAPSPTETS